MGNRVTFIMCVCLFLSFFRTRSSQGLNTTVPTKTRLDKMREMAIAKRKSQALHAQSIPDGMNSELHKLLGNRPLTNISHVPAKGVLVPINISLNSAFLSAKRSKMLGTPSTQFFRTQKRHHRLKTFRDRNVNICC